MKKLVVFLCACLALASASVALGQNPNTKWGKPSQTEWSLQAWGEAPDAEAVVLCKTMNLTYALSSQFASYSETGTSEMSLSSIANLGSNESTLATMNYDVKMRTKILKDSGAKFANVDIVYFNMESDRKMLDGLGRIKVTVFSMNEKGKVQRREVKAKEFTEDRVDENYVVRHLKVDGVKAGDIIEYQYEISSTRISFLYDFTFQEEIPVLYAKCDMDIPAFLQFNLNTPVHPFVKAKAESSSIVMEQSAVDMQAPKRCPSNHYVIEGHDILPKGLDLLRKNPTTEAAKVQSNGAEFLRTVAVLKNQNIAKPAPMPIGKSHLMLAQ